MKNFRLKGSPSGWGTCPCMFPDRTYCRFPAVRLAGSPETEFPISQARPGFNPQGVPCGLGLAAARARARFVRVRALGVRPNEGRRFFFEVSCCASISFGLRLFFVLVHFAKGAVLLAQNVFLPYLWRKVKF